jgi:hypothetical protein
VTDGVAEASVPAAAPPPEPKPNSLQRIVGVLTAPDETFRSIVRRPDWVMPLLIVVVLSIASMLLLTSHIDFSAAIREAMEAQGQTADPQVMRFAVSFAKITFYLSPLIGIFFLVVTAMLLLVAFRIFGGEGEFSHAFSIVLYAWMPQLIRSVIAVIVLLMRPSITLMDVQEPIRSNLAFLFDAKAQPLMFALFGSFDVFTFWTLFLLTIGFAHMSRFSKAKSAAIVLTVWAAATMVKLIGPAIAQSRVGSGS